MPLGCSWQPRLASILEQLPLSFRSWGRQSSSKEFRYPQLLRTHPLSKVHTPRIPHKLLRYCTHKAGRGYSAKVCFKCKSGQRLVDSACALAGSC